MKNKQSKLLYKPIRKLGFSDHFCTQCNTMGFKTIDEILKTERADLVLRESFSYHWLEELVSFLQTHNQLHLLQ